MSDPHDIISRVPYCGREHAAVGFGTACDIVAALNQEGFVIVPASLVDIKPAPNAVPPEAGPVPV